MGYAETYVRGLQEENLYARQMLAVQAAEIEQLRSLIWTAQQMVGAR